MGPFTSAFFLLLIAVFSIVIFVLPYLAVWYGWKKLNTSDDNDAFDYIITGGAFSILFTLLALDGIYYFFVWLVEKAM